ncbi:Programmed cell death protein 4 [Rhynchospora pubera]|uniref:Programmed cell death protein 4 n=1 Tax=Rhynchospora pubera TaxID=906938 RepID=A0AAV8F731_9POAL|nr:Programmed cell death protein 4 [Rhynchospora pubera]
MLTEEPTQLPSLNPKSKEKYDKELDKLRTYKKAASLIINEYLSSHDMENLIINVVNLHTPEYNPIFIKRLVTVAMDRKNKIREMASFLLSALSMEIFTTEDVMTGFAMLLDSIDDTALDILDASDKLAMFLARAVRDDVLAPVHLELLNEKYKESSTASKTIAHARNLAFSPHAGERLERCWGGSSDFLKDIKEKIVKLLEEYQCTGDLGEACRGIRDIGMPFFNHEVVKKGLIMAMEKKSDRILDLLQECYDQGVISVTQLTEGFGRVRDVMDDLVLDIPKAAEIFNSYVEHAKKHDWIICESTSTV